VQRVLVFQTAFTGDVILTLPMIQRLKLTLPEVLIDVVATPAGAAVLANHPAVDQIIPYDKKKTERGLLPALRLARRLRARAYDVAIIPHRSIRSAGLCYAAGIPRRIGFSTSAGRFLLTDIVPYDGTSHEIRRNMALLEPLGIAPNPDELPSLYPSAGDVQVVERLLDGWNVRQHQDMIAIAPGSVWATKRWLPERYHELALRLTEEGFAVVLIGGKEDVTLGEQIAAELAPHTVLNAMGALTVLQSAELIRRCRVAVTNDSSPMHIAVAMRTPVVAIFGATVPEFGFAPVGKHDQIVQTSGLPCRPCAIHGGNRCPITTFDCMKNITVEQVLASIHHVLVAQRAGVV
jgi:heptosyltransferase-2